ncbi:MAG TPA: GAF domain-containing protein, partial [Gemmatimonadales bacterium]|nr:GAF domain-containing protein [Gemmatimonadales bacterium]
MTHARPDNETERLAALARYRILDTPQEQAFDDLAQLAAAYCEAPIAFVSLVDEHRQWFKASLGLGFCETPRDMAFCSYAILEPDLLVVHDTTADPRFADNPFVTGQDAIRFYAGVPLRTPDGHAIGVLAIMDRRPRTLTPSQVDAFRRLARQAVGQLELHRVVAEQARQAEQLEALIAAVPLAIVKFTGDGIVLGWSPAAERMFGWTAAEAIGQVLPNVPPEQRGTILSETL